MPDVTLKQLAPLIGTSTEKLFEQFRDAGISIRSSEQPITNDEKVRLLEFLRRSYVKRQQQNQSPSLHRRRVSISQVPNSSATAIIPRRTSFTSSTRTQKDETVADTLIRVRQELIDVERAKRDAEEGLKIALALEQLMSSYATDAHTNAMRKSKSDFSSDRKSSIVEGFKRNIQKLRVREKDLASKATYDNVPIVIDGSNLCYENHSNWIGLDALHALVGELALYKFDVTVVFDQSTAERLKSSDQPVSQVFDGSAKVSIAEGKADQIILREAARSGGYIISNDAFVDLPELRDRLSKARFIGHRISDGSVRVRGLGIQIPYIARRLG